MQIYQLMSVAVVVVGCLLLSSCLSDDPISHLNPQYGEDLLASYSNDLPGYEDSQAAAAAPMSGIDMLRMSVPGDPGQASYQQFPHFHQSLLSNIMI